MQIKYETLGLGGLKKGPKEGENMRHERTGASRGKEAGKNKKGNEEEGEDRRQTRGRKGLEAGEDIRQERTEGRRG